MASSAFDLNGAASEFSIRLIKDKVAALADECNQDLEGDLAQLRAILDHVDQKRLKFQESKSDLLQGLRATLSSLQVDASIVNTTLADIAATSAPPLLSAIPTPSSFHLESLLLTPAASPPGSGLADTTKTHRLLDAASSDTVSDRDDESKATSGESTKANMPSESRAPGERQGHGTDDMISSPNPQALAVHREKRPRESPEAEIAEQEPKKAKTSPTKSPTHVVSTEVTPKLRMQDLDAIECVFRRAERDGFFVIRCLEPDCSLRIADSMPFKYKRAFNHFNTKHLKQPQTEEYIFNKFAFQVEDATEESIAVRYNDSEIPECNPKSTLQDTNSAHSQPESPGRVSKAVSFGLERSPSLGYQAGGPSRSSKSDSGFNPSNINGENSESGICDQGQVRHNLRRLPRLSYTLMAHGRDPTPPDAQDQTEGVKTESGILKRAGNSSNSLISTRSSRSATKAPKSKEKPRRSSEQPYKPFGHTGEWPRRSAPS